MQGKPYTGNPHVRFDEGAGAPRHSGRPALLYKKIVLITALYGASALFADPVKTYSHPMDPRLHPDDARRLVKPPDAKTFNNRLQFSNLRRMRESGYKGALDSHVVRDRLGDVVWPHIGMIYNKNVREQAEELKRRGLYMLGLWAFEPGSRPEVPDGVGQFKRPAGVTEMFEEVLGDHWFGMENGEQDGKYARTGNPRKVDREVVLKIAAKRK